MASLTTRSGIYYIDFYSSAITVRHLLAHSAGLPNPIPLSWIHLQEEHASFDRDEFFRSVFERHPKLKGRPNEHFGYSNLGYILLGLPRGPEEGAFGNAGRQQRERPQPCRRQAPRSVLLLSTHIRERSTTNYRCGYNYLLTLY